MASTIIFLAALAAGRAHAFDAAGIDIIGLRLGMQEAEVISRLGHQGYTVDRTPAAIGATTRDGRLLVTLSGSRGVTELTYVFRARGGGEPAMVRDSVLVRFGDPDQVQPPTWCRALGPDGMCPSDQPSLTFLPDTLTLTLRGEAGTGR